MLKKTVINICSAIGYIASFLLTKKLFWFLSLIRDSIYSAWIKSSIKKAGNNFSAQYPINYVGLKYISIGNNFSCFSRLRLEAFDKHLSNSYSPIINIGNNVSINFDCHIACVNNIMIGNNVLIASKVFITDHSHGEINAINLQIPPSERKVISKGPVIIEDNVWVGEGVAIMPDVTIGKNSIIGANAVVTKSFPKDSLIGGNPAKLIKVIE
jgi:acetyltransferase-like isoleucine patch superfamily enzyme